MRPVAVIGNLACDRVEGLPPRVGGAPFHCARALRVLGYPARIVAKCADADRRTLVRPLVALGVPISWRPAGATAAFSFAYEGDERTMSVEALGEPWTPDEARGWVAEALGPSAWLHVGALARSDFPAETLAELARGRRLSLDGQSLVRPGRTGPLELDGEFDPLVLRHVSVLKLAEEEAGAALGEKAPSALGVPEVVVTLAAGGSLVWADGELERVRAHPVAGDVDPTGAGDAFAATYVAARAAGQRPVTAARRATALVGALLARRAA